MILSLLQVVMSLFNPPSLTNVTTSTAVLKRRMPSTTSSVAGRRQVAVVSQDGPEKGTYRQKHADTHLWTKQDHTSCRREGMTILSVVDTYSSCCTGSWLVARSTPNVMLSADEFKYVVAMVWMTDSSDGSQTCSMVC